MTFRRNIDMSKGARYLVRDLKVSNFLPWVVGLGDGAG